ncbi:hypothetical protein V2G26_012734 [Clonostachys chloroleuca]
MSKTISLAEIGAIIDPVLDSEKGSASDARVSDFRDGVSWSPEEEKKLVSKIDSIVLTILTLCFFAFQLDRSNIGNALTDQFLKDVGVTQNEFNIGQQLLNAGIVLLEIPSNMILYRLGPKTWIGCQIIAWGLVATFQAFQRGLGAFLATRLVLGLLESGFIPASLYTLGLWYKNSELSRRFGFFYLGNGIAQACGGLLANGFLRMRGIGNLTGWQWLFLLEGIFTLMAGAIFIALFPGNPQDPVSLLKVNWFTERETFVMQQRMQLQRANETPHSRIRGNDILCTLAQPKLWPHLLITMSGLAPTTALWSYAPTIIGDLGYNRLAANAMTSVGQWISVLLIMMAAYVADWTDRRGFIVLFGITCQWAFMVAFTCLPDSSASSLKYGILTMGTATCSWWHIVNGSWLSINARSPEERSIRMALYGMSANTAGIIGGQLFRSDDLPYYHRGWTVIVCLMSLTLSLAIFLLVLYFFSNRKIKKENKNLLEQPSSDTTIKNNSAGPVQRVPYNF